MLDSRRRRPDPALAALGGLLPMSNGLSRLQTRFLPTPRRSTSCSSTAGRSIRKEALDAGLVTFAPDAHRLGRRAAAGARGARGHLARRADRHGGQPALRRPRDDGDQDLRPPLGLAELDLQRAQRDRREGRAGALRPQAASGPSSTGAGRRKRAAMSTHQRREDPQQRRPGPGQAAAARARAVAAQLHLLVDGDGARRASRATTSTCAPPSA